MRTRVFRSVLPAVIAVSCALFCCKAGAQNAQLRTVHGEVVDKSDSPAPTSIVYLLNAKTQAVRTYFADDKGEYHFSGLDPNVDYEIHAERGNTTSSTRKISSYDSRRDIDIILKLAHEKGSKDSAPPS
jgi:hypothetical protein